jgi:hypothetical protein
MVGGHGMIAVGWKQINNKEYLIVHNSWADFGDNGKCYICINDYPISEMWGVVDDNLQYDINKPMEIKTYVGKNLCIIDNKKISMQFNPIYLNNLIYFPMTFFQDVFGYQVEWYVKNNINTHYDDEIIIKYGGETMNI